MTTTTRLLLRSAGAVAACTGGSRRATVGKPDHRSLLPGVDALVTSSTGWLAARARAPDRNERRGRTRRTNLSSPPAFFHQSALLLSGPCSAARPSADVTPHIHSRYDRS